MDHLSPFRCYFLPRHLASCNNIIRDIDDGERTSSIRGSVGAGIMKYNRGEMWHLQPAPRPPRGPVTDILDSSSSGRYSPHQLLRLLLPNSQTCAIPVQNASIHYSPSPGSRSPKPTMRQPDPSPNRARPDASWFPDCLLSLVWQGHGRDKCEHGCRTITSGSFG